MRTETTHHVDASEPDSDGKYEYRYEYDIYVFSEDRVAVVARSYTDEPDEAHFLRIEDNGKSELMKRTDLRRPLVLNAARHLRELGKKRLNWLSGRGNGYEPVALES